MYPQTSKVEPLCKHNKERTTGKQVMLIETFVSIREKKKKEKSFLSRKKHHGQEHNTDHDKTRIDLAKVGIST